MTASSTVQRKRGAALEDAILEAAYAELSEAGYGAFSVEAVAARARSGKASIYRRWPTKQLLVLDAMCAQMPTAQECGLDRVLPDSVSTIDALHEIARSISAILASPDGAAMRAIKCEAVSDPELAHAIDERFQAPRRAALVELLRRGVERGEVRPGAATAIVADVLPSVLTYRIIMQREAITERDLRAIVDQVLVPLLEPR